MCGLYANGVDEMRLSATRRSIDEHRVELHGVGVFGNGHAYGARQFVAVSLNIIVESKVRIQLRIDLLRLCRIEY